MGKVKDNLKEAKEKAINAVKAFFKFLKDFAFRNSIAEKLEEIEAQLQEGIENDLYTQEQLKKLTNTMDSLAGQLRNMSPEAMKETAEKAAQEINALIDEMYGEGRILTDVNEEDFFTAMKNISGHSDMTNEQFRDFFEQNAKLYDNGGMKLEKGQIEGKTTMLIEIGSECYQATFNVSEARATNDDPGKKKRDYTLTVDKFNGSYADAKEIVSKADISKHETMLRKFILPRNLRRPEDIKRLDISKLVKTSTAIRDVQTIEKFASSVKESQDSKYEFFYDKQSNTFRARDKESQEMLIFAMKKGELVVIPAKNVSDIQHINEKEIIISNDRSVFRHEAGKGIIDFNVMGMNDSQMSLFRTNEIMQFLETKGIPTNELKYHLATSDNPERKPVGYSKVSREGLPNVDILYRALYETVSREESAFDVKAIRDSRKFKKGGLDGAVYLSIADKEGNQMSFSFEEDGTPRDINYKAKGGKFKLAQNLNLGCNYGADYETLRYDEAFAKLFDTFKTAYNLYENRTQQRQKDVPEKSAPASKQTDDKDDSVLPAAPVTPNEAEPDKPFDPDGLSDVMSLANIQDTSEYAEQLLKATLSYLQMNDKDVQSIDPDNSIGFPATTAAMESVKTVLLDYEIEKDDIDKILAGKGLKSQRMLENMKNDLTDAFEALNKEVPVQETEEVKPASETQDEIQPEAPASEQESQEQEDHRTPDTDDVTMD